MKVEIKTTKATQLPKDIFNGIEGVYTSIIEISRGTKELGSQRITIDIETTEKSLKVHEHMMAYLASEVGDNPFSEKQDKTTYRFVLAKDVNGEKMPLIDHEYSINIPQPLDLESIEGLVKLLDCKCACDVFKLVFDI